MTKLEQNKWRWVARLKEGDSRALELLYRMYRKEFIEWLMQKQRTCTVELAVDIFQESVLALYKHAKAGRLDELQSSIKTYLFAIGNKLFLLHNRTKKVKTVSFNVEDGLLEDLKVVPTYARTLTDRQQLIADLLPRLRFVCQDLLHMFYYEDLSMKTIAKRKNYKSVNVAKAMKARCMENFRKMVSKHLKAK